MTPMQIHLSLPRKKPAMWIRRSSRKSSAAFALTLMTLVAASARAQAPQSSPSNLEEAITALRVENAAIREQLKTLTDIVTKLQRRSGGEPATVVREFPSP